MQITCILVCEDGWELATVADIQLIQERGAPCDDLPFATWALKILSCHVVEGINVQHLLNNWVNMT